ncbi:MAG: hypothetical protein Q4B42_02730 [Oscillospiraceae bacterium]|nr:hypothetical protein [Oscillospiraceae bacterium]
MKKDVHNLNLVSPTQYAGVIAEALEKPFPLPVVWNTGGYERLETLRLLEGKVQVYLSDMKYADDALALRLSGAGDYFSTACAAAKEMFRQTGSALYDEQGLMIRGLMIRHLALPGHFANTKAVIDWFSSEFSSRGALFSLMTQYTPMNELGRFPELRRRLSRRECARLEEYLYASGIKEGYVQERSSAGCEFIPAFDLTGLC